MEELMDLEYTIMEMEPTMKVIGLIIYNKVKELRSGLMVVNLMVILFRAWKMALEHINGRMVVFILDNGDKTELMDMVNIAGKMVNNMKGNG